MILKGRVKEIVGSTLSITYSLFLNFVLGVIWIHVMCS